MGNSEFFPKLISALSSNNTINPVIFSIPYLAKQSPWIEKYRKIYEIAHKHEVADFYLLSEMKKVGSKYFQKFQDPQFYQNYNFTKSQFQFINKLILLDLNGMESSLKNTLIHYCIGSLTSQQYSHIHDLWVDSINTFISQNNTRLKDLIDQGCELVNRAAQNIINHTSLIKIDQLEEINDLVNTNSNIVQNLEFKATSVYRKYPASVLNGLAYLFKNISDNQPIDFDPPVSILMNNSTNLARQFVRDIENKSPSFVMGHYHIDLTQYNLTKRVLDYADQHMILPSLKDSFVKGKILADLNHYFLHYYAMLVKNYLQETYYNRGLAGCQNFFTFFIDDLQKDELKRICNHRYSEQGKLAEICFIECSKFNTSLTTCDCTFAHQLLERGKAKLVQSVKNFTFWVRLTTPHQKDYSLTCKYYQDECPPFIVVIQELNTSMLSLLGSQFLEYVNCEVQKPFTLVDKFDPAPIFREKPYINVLNRYKSPWQGINAQDWWLLLKIFVKQDLVPPHYINFARSIFFTSYSPFRHYSTRILDQLSQANTFQLGNPCYNYSQPNDFQFFQLNVTFTDKSVSQLSHINKRTILERDVYELDTDFKTCNLSHSQPLFGQGQSVTGSLGYMLPLNSRFNRSQFIYNNYLRRVLQYDEFECPEIVDVHKKYGVERRCYILNTNVLGDSGLDFQLDGFLNLTHAYRGAYYASMVGICGINFGECEQAGIENAPNIDCRVQYYDRDHQSRSNWISVDRQTGVILYSELNYALWGFGDNQFLREGIPQGCYLVPLFDVKEQIMYNYTQAQSKWKGLIKVKQSQQAFFFVVGCFTIVLLVFFVYQLKVMITARETQRLYSFLKKKS